MEKHVSPKFGESTFNCPHCDAYSDQYFKVFIILNPNQVVDENWHTSCCKRCKEITIWHNAKILYPSSGDIPMPNSDMPKQVMNDYLEAREIVNLSPRSSCVLLRLAIEKLCGELDVTGDLNAMIKKLVAKGLDERIQKALDSVRVIGGQAVHPLEMDLKDDEGTAKTLFSLVNIITDWAFTQKKKIDSVYASLPNGKLDAIKDRDEPKAGF
jgi:hypothetical protein